jgi:DNA-binding response OmpR family regulator
MARTPTSEASLTEADILIVEGDVLARHPLAEYLRQCGFRVFEAATADEARTVISEPRFEVSLVLADLATLGASGFSLAAWVREHHPEVQMLMAGTMAKTVEKAGDLCADGPSLSKPYDHQFVLDHIRRLVAGRDRAR